MAKDVVIRISATDAASPTFKRIASEAKSMGAQVTTSANQSARSLDDMQKKATSLGAGIGTLIGGAALAGRAFQSQEQQIRGLNRAYGESSIEIQKFAKELQQSTVYSDDAARQSAQLASTLIRNYGLTADQVELLIARTADLASINVTATGAQFDLVDAVQRTSSAIRGEAESAEALGLTMNDAVVAAEAARRGLVGWTTTMTDAEKAQFRFTLLLEQSTYAQGAAAEAADTNAGKAKQLMNQVQDLTQEFGGALGPMGEYLSVLGDLALAAPLVGAGIGKITAALTALGGGKAGAIGGIAALYALDAYLLYDVFASRGKAGGGIADTVFATGGATAADLLKKFTPGSTGDALFNAGGGYFRGLLKENEIEEAFRKAFFGVTDNKQVAQIIASIVSSGGFLGFDGIESLPGLATGKYLSLDEYIQQQAGKAGYVYDAKLGQYLTRDQYARRFYGQTLAANNGTVYDPRLIPMLTAPAIPLADQLGTSRYYGDITSTAYTGPFQPGPRTYDGPAYAAGASPTYAGDLGVRTGGFPFGAANYSGLGATGGGDLTGGFLPIQQPAMLPSGSSFFSTADLDLLNSAKITAALKEQYGAYYDLAMGIDTAKEARSAFKVVQDEILGKEQMYSAQQSEFQSQVDAQDAAYELLNKRKEEGIEISEKEQAFLDNYAKANERGTGAVEDAIIAQGLLAQQYLLNMENGDKLNETLRENAGSMSELVTVIEDLILAMYGVPDEVKTKILLDRDDAMTRLLEYTGALYSIPGTISTALRIYPNLGTDVTRFFGGGMDGMTMHSYAGGGTHYGGGNWAIVGERGPEGVWLPNGAQVMNTEGSKSRAGSGGPMFAGPVSITVVANNPHQFATALREYSVGGSRG